MDRYVCIHGHFYQPPRENPWLEEVEMQDSAYPYHDWNERIAAECYAPNAASRILDSGRRIIDIVNNYSKISFNFGPTLLSWMERHAPDVHRAIVEADRQSLKNFSGHGSALAQVYNHMIMPLANGCDKRTQVIWGLKDFEYRFGRKPEGMWLSEAAADTDSLEALAEHGIRFTILAPRQAGRVRRLQGGRWRNVGNGRIDPKMPYVCRLPSGRTITLFFYDGPISQDIAFGGLLRSGESFASRLMSAFTEGERPQLVHIATDGETYGHHHRHGDMALAYAIHHIESNDLARITNYGEYLEKHPPTHEAEIVQNSSWSCDHGVERWRSNCGCNTGRAEWHQEWRGPLREALNWLRDELAPIYGGEMAGIARDPWRARDEYIDVILDRSAESVEWFLSRHASRELRHEEKVKALRLLEMQRHAQLMFTSCGWFFDEVSGIEGVQVLMYAARAIQLAEKVCGAGLEPGFLEIIRQARSNIPGHRDGAWVYENFVKPASIDLLRVGAHYGVSSLFEDYRDEAQIYSYTVRRELYDRNEAGRQKLATGMAHMRSNITWAESDVSFAVVHLGDHNLIGGVREFIGAEEFGRMQSEIKVAFQRSDIPQMIHLMDEHFRAHSYSLWHLFRDEQRRVLGRILASTLAEVEVSYRRIYDHHYPIMQMMRELSTPIPKAFVTAAEFSMNAELRNLIEDDDPDAKRLQELISDIKRWSFEADTTTLAFLATNRINVLMDEIALNPEGVDSIERVETLLDATHSLGLDIDRWKAQNGIFSINSQVAPRMRERAESGDRQAAEWVEHINKVSEQLGVRGA